MIGKKNVIFGFLFLAISAALGPLMVLKYNPAVDEAKAEKQAPIGRIQQLKTDEFEENLEPISPLELAKANTLGLLSLNKLFNASDPKNLIKAGPHAHGNLESLLNIVVGLFLGFVAVAPLFKQAISWIFIGGTVLHSGILYLFIVFDQAWALTLAPVGPILILLGLVLCGVAAAIGFKGELVSDKN